MLLCGISTQSYVFQLLTVDYFISLVAPHTDELWQQRQRGCARSYQRPCSPALNVRSAYALNPEHVMTPLLQRMVVRNLQAAFVCCLSFNLVRAGDISGRVLDGKSGGYLPGATVVLVGTGQTEVTDSEGRFLFADVPAGEAAITVDYLGYAGKTESVTVPASGSVPLEVLLGESVLQLEKFVIEGYREGRAKALQQKRTAPNVLEIISADSVGNLPDQNVAEALSRVAGVNIDVDSGEGRFITIRGIEPNLNNVTLNGATLAAPGVDGRAGRSMPLDVIAASQISQIEVIKSVTPDMDGNALGGTINVKTVSGFDRKERFVYGAVEYGETRAANEAIHGADFTYGNTFGADKNLGVAFAASFSQRPYVKHDLQANWATLNNQLYMSTFEILPEEGERERLGLNLNLEHRPGNDAHLWVRALYNKFDEFHTEDEIIMEARRDPVFVASRSVTFDRMRYEIRSFVEETEQTLFNLTAGGSRRFDRLTVEGDLTYSYAEEFNPDLRSVQFRTGNVNVPALFAVDFSGFYPRIDDKGSLAAASTVYPLRRVREETSSVEEETDTPRLDFTWNLEDWFGGRSGFLKAGAKYTERSRFVDDNSVRPVNSALTIDTIGARGPGRTVWDGRYSPSLLVNLPAAFTFLNANRGLLTVDPTESASNSIEDDYDIGENILALYAMGSLEVNDRLTALAGARYERTEASVIGFELREANGSFQGVFTNRGDFDYDNFLPNLQFRYDLSERAVLRAAVTATIGRPAYESAAPISVLEYDAVIAPINPAFPNTGALEIGNPRLSPYEALNYDLALEYYLASGGLISAGVFHKAIDNPIYEFQETLLNTTYNGIALERLDISSVQNADSGKVTGFELNLQLPFTSFTTGFFGGFGIDANATFIDSEATLILRPADKIPFFRQPDKIYNLAFYYQGHGFSARVAWNYQDESIRTIGGGLTTDFWRADRYQTDVQASYKFNDRYSIFFKWKNVTDQSNDLYIGDKNRLRNAEFYGSDIRAGMRFNF